MSTSGDPEAYAKGYEDAMHAAGTPAASPPTAATTASTTKKAGASGGRDISGKLQRGIGTAIGWLIVFPLGVGLLGGAIFWALGFDFTTWAVACGGVAFLIAAFMLVVRVGWTVFINLWPVLLVVGVVALIIIKLL
jgi:hypothetical protein